VNWLQAARSCLLFTFDEVLRVVVKYNINHRLIADMSWKWCFCRWRQTSISAKISTCICCKIFLECMLVKRHNMEDQVYGNKNNWAPRSSESSKYLKECFTIYSRPYMYSYCSLQNFMKFNLTFTLRQLTHALVKDDIIRLTTKLWKQNSSQCRFGTYRRVKMYVATHPL